MRISINNFKSIEDLVRYELKPLTIISGVNSSGKSSFVQLLLLLKQTIERNSPDEQLYLNGELYKVRNFADILSGKNTENKLRVEFEFSKKEDLRGNSDKRISIFDSFEDYNITVELIYDFLDGKIFISEFTVKYLLPEGEKKEQFLVCSAKNEKGKINYTIEANNNLFGKDLWHGKPINVTSIIYSSIYPWYYQMHNKVEQESPNKEADNIYQEKLETIFFNLEGIKELIDSIFKSFSYIGPIRQEPRDEYTVREEHNTVGSDGSFVSQVLENNSNKPIEFYKPTFRDNGEVFYEKVKTTLLNAVKYWMCDVFKIGTDIYVEKTNDVYVIYLVGEKGIKTTIKHVGFGISQVLPIIVEGLLMKINSTLILEQPEIHLHPKLQSLLFDYLHSLTLQGKNIITETHSDHFITRMRRRVAEDMQNNLADNVNLTFIETLKGKVLFRSIDVDDLGAIEYFPENFIDQTSSELKAILNAQIKKQATKK